MNLLLFEPDELKNDNTVELRDRRSVHLVQVLGCGPGDHIRAGIINGPIGSGEILAVRGKGKRAAVTLRFSAGSHPPERPSVDLILGLVRPIMLKRLLAQAASLGVGRIFLINGGRVEKSFFEASLLQDENFRPYLIQGLEQAKDTILPQVSIHQRFRPFIEDFIPTVSHEYDRMLVAHPEAGRRLKELKGLEQGGRVLLAIGPEGGWLDFEIEKFVGRSFQPVSLGQRILRTDTAVVALLAQLMLLRGDQLQVGLQRD